MLKFSSLADMQSARFPIDFEQYPLDGVTYHRFDRNSEQSGWMRGYVDPVDGTMWVDCGDNSGKERYQYCSTQKTDPVELQKLNDRRAEVLAQNKVKQEALWSATQKEAASLLPTFKTKLTPYMEQKGFKNPYGTMEEGEGICVVPCVDIDGVLWGFQRIFPNRDKRFLLGTKKKGSHHVISPMNDPDIIYFAEGVATAATVHELTNKMTVSCFDADNLVQVAKAYSSKYPYVQLVIASDNDLWRKDSKGRGSNKGRDCAIEAAELTGALIAIPHLPHDISESLSKPTDFNDYVILGEAEKMKACLEKPLTVGEAARIQYTLIGPPIGEALQPVAQGPNPEANPNLEAQKPVSGVNSAPPATGLKALGIQSLADIMDEPEENIPWILRGLLQPETISLLVAKPKAGKTTFARQLCHAVANGLPFLGLETSPQSVLYLSMEDNKRQLKRHFTAFGAPKHEFTNIDFRFGGLGQDPMKIITGAMAAKKYGFIVLDTLAKVLRITDINSYTEVGNNLRPIRELVQRTGVHVLMVHHAGKSERVDLGDNALGSTALYGEVDVGLFIGRDDKERANADQRLIKAQGRDVDAFIDTQVLNFDRSTKRFTMGGTRQEVATKNLEQAILDLLGASPKGLSTAAVCEEVTGAKAKIIRALTHLVEKGYVLQSGGEAKGEAKLNKINPAWKGQEA